MNHSLQDDFFDFFKAKLQKTANKERAISQKSYMREQFEFLGVSKPELRKIYKEFKNKFQITKVAKDLAGSKNIVDIINKCYNQEHREYVYLALFLLEDNSNIFAKNDNFGLIEKYIESYSWWDSIDVLGPNVVGKIFLKDAELKKTYLNKWQEMDNFWFNRICIIFQLKYKEKTDFEYLKFLCLKYKNTKEFFVQKALGWALREYSKTSPKVVEDFVIKNQDLPKLTKKEGIRIIKAK